MSVKITVRIQKDPTERMDKLTHINWSEVVRRAIEEKVKQALKVMEEISSKAKPEKPTKYLSR